MVSRRLYFIAYLLAAGCAAGAGCAAIDRSEPSSNIIGGSRPIVLSAEPNAASGGDTVTITGQGFSYIAPENVISVGGIAQTAEVFDISEDGTQSLVFTLSEDAAEGETEIIIITEGKTSNVFPFTVSSPP